MSILQKWNIKLQYSAFTLAWYFRLPLHFFHVQMTWNVHLKEYKYMTGGFSSGAVGWQSSPSTCQQFAVYFSLFKQTKKGKLLSQIFINSKSSGYFVKYYFIVFLMHFLWSQLWSCTPFCFIGMDLVLDDLHIF